MQEIVTKTKYLMEAAHTTLTGSELQVLTVECIWWHRNSYYCSRRFLYVEDSMQRMESLVNRLAENEVYVSVSNKFFKHSLFM
jgi:hypothetical protein